MPAQCWQNSDQTPTVQSSTMSSVRPGAPPAAHPVSEPRLLPHFWSLLQTWPCSTPCVTCRPTCTTHMYQDGITSQTCTNSYNTQATSSLVYVGAHRSSRVGTLDSSLHPASLLWARVPSFPSRGLSTDLMITVGTVYMSIEGAPIKEIMKDMMEMTRGVQHPTRGLFLRHYLSGMTRDHLPVGDDPG